MAVSLDFTSEVFAFLESVPDVVGGLRRARNDWIFIRTRVIDVVGSNDAGHGMKLVINVSG